MEVRTIFVSFQQRTSPTYIPSNKEYILKTDEYNHLRDNYTQLYIIT